MKQSFEWRQSKCQEEHQLMPRGKGLESAGRVTFRPGRRYGIPGSGVSYPIDRVMSRRRYGVSSDGDKFKGLAIKCEMERGRRASVRYLISTGTG